MQPNLSFFDQLADAAAEQTLPRFRSQLAVENKRETGFDPVTEADKASERAIRALIETQFPDHGILGEEEDSKNLDSEYVWVIDPIDGTRAFITGLPVWGTLVGLYHNGRAIMGMMDQPYIGERYLSDGKKSWLKRVKFDGTSNERTLKTSACKDLSSANIFTTSPYLQTGPNKPKYKALEETVNMARYGCDCYAFGLVAMGTAEIAIESGLAAYDIAGLISIVECAGGVVTNWDGHRPEKGGEIIASANQELHNKALDILAKY